MSRWINLSAREKWGFCRAVFALLLIKAGLFFLPFSTFRKVYQRLASSTVSDDITELRMREIVWAVNTAANLLPMELLCLPRALATKYLMRNVPEITLEIGIEINPGKAFEAHAWVERNGRIIIGDWLESISYQRLWVWH